mmetsp:Transcript_14028/g.23834  ORF Transcript_14028/g.23834 Transcript_14028/m.23834 type:complete len:233 (-) Transcript_14028:17-715(-)
MLEVLAGNFKLGQGVLICHCTRVDDLCVLEVVLVVGGVGSQDLLIAEHGLLKVLLGKIDVRKLSPALLIDLVALKVPIKHRDRILKIVVVSVERDQTLHGQRVVRSALQYLQVDLLCLGDIALGLIEHPEEPYRLEVIRELLADGPEENLGPVDLLHVEGGEEELLHQIHVLQTLKLTRVILGNVDSKVKDQFGVLALLVLLDVFNQALPLLKSFLGGIVGEEEAGELFRLI